MDVKKSFQEFYCSFGIVEYPFALYTSENEKDSMEDLFIEPLDYAPIKENFSNKSTMIIIGNRGTGKTAILYDLQRKIDADKDLVCNIEDYSKLNLNPSIKEYYDLLITSLVNELFNKLVYDTKKIKNLGEDEKLLLSFLLTKYTNTITKQNLKRKIESIQVGRTKKILIKGYNYLRNLLNYGTTAATNIINDVIRNHFALLPPLEESKVKEFFPELSNEVDTDFDTTESSYNLLNRISSVVKKINYERIIFMIDKIDEDTRLENDADSISDFIKPLLTDNKLLLNEDIQIIAFVWAVPFNFLRDSIRTQKHYCPNLKWRLNDLENALNKRLEVFSNKVCTNYKELFDDDVEQEDIAKIFKLANSNPRDLWHVFNRLFEAQYEINSNSNKISKQAVLGGINNFVRYFNFYEYYPRKKGSRSNSMDIYSYIAHILKVKNKEFTKNQLNESAGTGSSTGNYVVGMESIGLICKTDKKINSGVVYEVIDPKVVHAIENDIEITKK